MRDAPADRANALRRKRLEGWNPRRLPKSLIKPGPFAGLNCDQVGGVVPGPASRVNRPTLRSFGTSRHNKREPTPQQSLVFGAGLSRWRVAQSARRRVNHVSIINTYRDMDFHGEMPSKPRLSTAVGKGMSNHEPSLAIVA